ncbi:phosphatidylinositol-specific phospholipase C [Streptomyces sp. TLI_171]|uniref:phosphatidylinositol-specific phospholipase C n=1 Tax=Streptomyces sp. TLI_171 TaxID=1938859 RepID=UPI000C359B3A|nr:phosphatidylinositol-specific phospholipase C [Streptomyces sp. TLI_171]RKE23179.1 1-phosphatidylinositol phosphodiesterase [Streptomyces sp. TLI_171]
MTMARRTLLTSGAAALAGALGGLALPARAAHAAPPAAPGQAAAPRLLAASGLRSTPGGVPTADWMARLDAGRSLLGLTVPGTHDSCCTDPAHGTEWSHTQNWGVPEQLLQGVRFLDIRCNGLQGTADELGVYHSDAYQYVRLQDVLDQCRAFLTAHPGETVVMRLRNENAGGQALDAAEFRRRINHYLDDLGYRALFHLYGWPTLGAARGRIVLVADFANDWGLIQWSSGSNAYFRTQDLWQTDQLFPLRVKGRAITQQFDTAAADPGSPQMYVNFLSYAGGYWPKTAEQTLMDQSIYPYLTAHAGRIARYGIVPMDFPDFHVNVLQALIDQNFLA